MILYFWMLFTLFICEAVEVLREILEAECSSRVFASRWDGTSSTKLETYQGKHINHQN